MKKPLHLSVMAKAALINRHLTVVGKWERGLRHTKLCPKITFRPEMVMRRDKTDEQYKFRRCFEVL